MSNSEDEAVLAQAEEEWRRLPLKEKVSGALLVSFLLGLMLWTWITGEERSGDFP